MSKFIPYQKQSKRQRKEHEQKNRQTWGMFNPVTRKPEKSNVYDRNKRRLWAENHNDGAFLYVSKTTQLPQSFLYGMPNSPGMPARHTAATLCIR